MDTRYGILHEQLMVNVNSNRSRPGSSIAFIGRQLCFFDANYAQPSPGSRVPVMITKCIYSTFPAAHEHAGRYNFEALRAMIIRVVTDAHMLVAINGFAHEKAGTKSSAIGIETDGTAILTQADCEARGAANPHDILILSPGPTDARSVVLGPDRPRCPTNVWVRRGMPANDKTGLVPIDGMTRVSDALWSHLVKD